MLLVAMPEVLEQCTLGQEKAYANNRADLPVLPYLKRLEPYPIEMSLINIVSNVTHLVPRIRPSRLFSGRVLVAFCCIPADKPNKFARVEVVLVRIKNSRR
jgi:hypothetical protein